MLAGDAVPIPRSSYRSAQKSLWLPPRCGNRSGILLGGSKRKLLLYWKQTGLGTDNSAKAEMAPKGQHSAEAAVRAFSRKGSLMFSIRTWMVGRGCGGRGRSAVRSL